MCEARISCWSAFSENQGISDFPEVRMKAHHVKSESASQTAALQNCLERVCDVEKPIGSNCFLDRLSVLAPVQLALSHGWTRGLASMDLLAIWIFGMDRLDGRGGGSARYRGDHTTLGTL